MISELLKKYINAYPSELTALLEGMPEKDVSDFLKKLSASECARLAPHLSSKYLKYIECLTDKEFIDEFCDTQEIDSIIDLYQLLNSDDKDIFKKLLPNKIRWQIKYLKTLPENSIAHFISDDYVSLQKDTDVSDAIALLNKLDRKISTVYIHNNHNKLLGEVYFKKLYTVNMDLSLSSLSSPIRTSINPSASFDDVKYYPAWQERNHLPVINLDGQLLGIVKIQSILQEFLNEEIEFKQTIYQGAEQLSNAFYSILRDIAFSYKREQKH